MRVLSIVICLSFICSQIFAQKVNLKAQPAGAKIYLIEGGHETLLGNTGQIKVSKSEPVSVLVKLSGYNTLTKTYSKNSGPDIPKEDVLRLEDRLVLLNVKPFNATISANGVNYGSRGSANVIVKKNGSVELLIEKTGYVSQKKTYTNKSGFDLPPESDQIELTDRTVSVSAQPAGAVIYVNEKEIDKGNALVVVPKDQCVVAKVAKPGFVHIEKTYCNKSNSIEPPLKESVVLSDRIVQVNTTPKDAIIKIDGKQVAQGSFEVKVNNSNCVEIQIEMSGFVNKKINLCNKLDMQEPPVAIHIQLKEDDAYIASSESDQANVNFTIEVAENTSEDEAWKIISQIIMNKFDILEITDKETGYMRTAWQVKKFSDNNRIVRSRVIVKMADHQPLKYMLKIASEETRDSRATVKNDELFKEWPRILNTYKDIINEVQYRL